MTKETAMSMLQCRWCEHDGQDHLIRFGPDDTWTLPCTIPGCDCDDYEEDTDLEESSPEVERGVAG